MNVYNFYLHWPLPMLHPIICTPYNTIMHDTNYRMFTRIFPWWSSALKLDSKSLSDIAKGKTIVYEATMYKYRWENYNQRFLTLPCIYSNFCSYRCPRCNLLYAHFLKLDFRLSFRWFRAVGWTVLYCEGYLGEKAVGVWLRLLVSALPQCSD